MQSTLMTAPRTTEWEAVAREICDPFAGAGTEQVGWLLYTLVRMTRPTCVLEYGSGYTTFFLLAALSHNVADVQQELEALRAKTLPLGTAADITRAFQDPKTALTWLGTGGRANAVDPGYYLTPHQPCLYSLEHLPASDPYTARLAEGVARAGLDGRLVYRPGAHLDEASLPPADTPIDFAWNDDRDYERFFEMVWPRLNPNGGLLVFHNTVASAAGTQAIEWMRAARADAGDLEVLTLWERHKLNQNSCSILRRKPVAPPEPLGLRRIPGVISDLARLFGI